MELSCALTTEKMNSNKNNFNWQLNGAFNFYDTFVRKNEFEIPRNTAVYITMNVSELYSDKNIYEWEVWEELTNKLIMKSNNRYLVWNFITKGIYTVKLTMIDENNKTHKHEKKSWIYVK